jgi:hypothetical protein
MTLFLATMRSGSSSTGMAQLDDRKRLLYNRNA